MSEAPNGRDDLAGLYEIRVKGSSRSVSLLLPPETRQAPLL
ncbi:MAG: hypothetical protein JWM93_550 [Frankiales bacterium]|nr:hypothetical protein [Frankiales bacterium]